MSKLAVEDIIAIEAGTCRGRNLTWVLADATEGFDALEVHEYEGPFGFFGAILRLRHGEIRLSVYGRQRPICRNEQVPCLEEAKADAIAAI
ncbi:hypothetical protein ACW9HR_37205 [Nocardia gipuzkoensis]